MNFITKKWDGQSGFDRESLSLLLSLEILKSSKISKFSKNFKILILSYPNPLFLPLCPLKIQSLIFASLFVTFLAWIGIHPTTYCQYHANKIIANESICWQSVKLHPTWFRKIVKIDKNSDKIRYLADKKIFKIRY